MAPCGCACSLCPSEYVTLTLRAVHGSRASVLDGDLERDLTLQRREAPVDRSLEADLRPGVAGDDRDVRHAAPAVGVRDCEFGVEDTRFAIAMRDTRPRCVARAVAVEVPRVRQPVAIGVLRLRGVEARAQGRRPAVEADAYASRGIPVAFDVVDPVDAGVIVVDPPARAVVEHVQRSVRAELHVHRLAEVPAAEEALHVNGLPLVVEARASEPSSGSSRRRTDVRCSTRGSGSWRRPSGHTGTSGPRARRRRRARGTACSACRCRRSARAARVGGRRARCCWVTCSSARRNRRTRRVDR